MANSKKNLEIIKSVIDLISIREFLMTAIESPKMISNENRKNVNILISKIDTIVVNNLLSEQFESTLENLIIKKEVPKLDNKK